MSETFLPFAYLQSQFIPFAEANISIATHALHYGTAAFAGMRGIPNPENTHEILLFRLDRHTQRLSEGARFLHYDLPASKIEMIIVDFVKKNSPQEPFYIRPLVYTSGLGLVPRLHNVEKDIFVYGLLLGDYLKGDGVTCRFSSWMRQADQSFPLRGKITGAYITSSLSKTEAVESGFDEALLVNAQGKVSEASGMNIFMVRQGRLVTPGFDQDILEGITRDSVMILAKEMGLEVIERPIDKSELFIASEVFLTGTAAKITPIRQIENYHLPKERPITTALKSKLTAITEGRDLDHADWVYRIPLE